MMRLALFCPDYPPSTRQGGIQDYSQCLARSLSHRGLDVTVVTGDGHAGSGTDGPVTVVKYPGPWDERWAARVVGELESRSVDLVNLQYSPAMFDEPYRLAWPSVAARFPSVVSFHTLWGGRRRNTLTALRLASTARSVIATNSEITYLLRRYLPWYGPKTVFIPIGSNITPHDQENIHEEVVQRFELVGDRCVLVYFGMTYPGKGLDWLLGTASCLLRESLDFRLLCVGGGVSDASSYQNERQRRVSELGLEDRITWTGRLPSSYVSSLLTLSDIVVLPYESGVSDRRGSLMAALVHGKPVVTTPPRIRIPHFENGGNMIWPESASPESLGRLILRVHGDRRLRQSLTSGALELASKLTWDRIAGDTIVVFEKVLDETAT